MILPVVSNNNLAWLPGLPAEDLEQAKSPCLVPLEMIRKLDSTGGVSNEHESGADVTILFVILHWL